MARSKISLIVIHFAGFVVCSIAAYAVWIITTAIALSPIVARDDDMPRTFEALPLSARFCSHFANAMSYPFHWIRPRSILDGPQAFVLMSLFWGGLVYLLLCGVLVLRRKGT